MNTLGKLNWNIVNKKNVSQLQRVNYAQLVFDGEKQTVPYLLHDNTGKLSMLFPICLHRLRLVIFIAPKFPFDTYFLMNLRFRAHS